MISSGLRAIIGKVTLELNIGESDFGELLTWEARTMRVTCQGQRKMLTRLPRYTRVRWRMLVKVDQGPRKLIS